MADLTHHPLRDAREGNVVRLRTSHAPRLLSKKQLAAELGRSPRWINLRMEEGLPVEPRALEHEHARFDLERVKAWLDERAQTKPLSLEERVALLERTVAALTDRRAS